MCNTYNGYTNYPTWAVGLWIDNDPSTSSYKDELVERAESAYDLATALKNWVESDQDEVCRVPGMFGDLLGWALQSVNWRELADNYFEEKEAEEDDAS